MNTAPHLVSDASLAELKRENFSGAIARGVLTSGQEYEIKLSAKSAVMQGFHFIITYPGRSELTPDEHVDAYRAANEFARSIPEAQQFGYRFAENFGNLLNRPEPHAHLIIAGSEVELKIAPRLVSSWYEDLT